MHPPPVVAHNHVYYHRLLKIVHRMKGTLQKLIGASALPCHTCSSFRDDDPDIFYCLLQREEFPGLCDDYQQAGEWVDTRNGWVAPNER